MAYPNYIISQTIKKYVYKFNDTGTFYFSTLSWRKAGYRIINIKLATVEQYMEKNGNTWKKCLFLEW